MSIDIPVDQTSIASPVYSSARPAIYEPHKGLFQSQTSMRYQINNQYLYFDWGGVKGECKAENIQNQGTSIVSLGSAGEMRPLSVKDYEGLMSDYDVVAIEEDHLQTALHFGW